MKKQNTNTNGNSKFWMSIAIMLGVFIVAAIAILIIFNPLNRDSSDDNPPTTVVEQQVVQDPVDNSFDATKDRVTEVNDNFGQSIKSSYAGNSSTMEAMMKQRMFFSGLKSTLIIILLIAAILLVIVKCFNISFKKKQTDTADAGESEISEEGRGYVRTVTEKKAKPTANPTPKKKEETKPKQKVKKVEKTTDADADEQDVADSCQLP